MGTAHQPDEAFGVVPTESLNVESIPFRDAMYQIWEFPGEFLLLFESVGLVSLWRGSVGFVEETLSYSYVY
ncbi:hypothetical protein BC938DRAFT_481619 [Jimgerdemannia flammicorona]|uniref:Uncharacterized protein n=1 Tax=Jimgerdemannia flammicorona TaxID=994334 RepID=A0A433QWW1_9FUNG|nr:hypothetical protein BC938DRAFT_481619 [Jimgerdemannia flammicorona]